MNKKRRKRYLLLLFIKMLVKMGYGNLIQYYGLKGKCGKVQEDPVHITVIQIQKEMFKKIEIKIHPEWFRIRRKYSRRSKFRFIYCDSDSEKAFRVQPSIKKFCRSIRDIHKSTEFLDFSEERITEIGIMWREEPEPEQIGRNTQTQRN